MGFLVSQHGQLGAIPPPPFLSIPPLESMCSGGAITSPPPPPKRDISAILARYPTKTRQNACDTPLCDTILNGYCAKGGGVSRIGPLGACMAPNDRRLPIGLPKHMKSSVFSLGETFISFRHSALLVLSLLLNTPRSQASPEARSQLLPDLGTSGRQVSARPI